MTQNLPLYVPVIFVLTTIAALFLFVWITKNSESEFIKRKSNSVSIILVLWVLLQSYLALSGTYHTNTDVLPPKILLYGFLPTVVACLFMFFTKDGIQFIDDLPLKYLTYINLLRIPVEFVLLWLFLGGLAPEIMTFRGWNFDIFIGFTAPIIVYFGFILKNLNNNIILIWNILGVFLLLAIITISTLSAPFPLQMFAFDQPNIGLLYFPYALLPTFVGPMVLFGHFVAIRQLWMIIKS